MNEWMNEQTIQDKIILISWSIYLPRGAPNKILLRGPKRLWLALNFCIPPSEVSYSLEEWKKHFKMNALNSKDAWLIYSI